MTEKSIKKPFYVFRVSKVTFQGYKYIFDLAMMTFFTRHACSTMQVCFMCTSNICPLLFANIYYKVYDFK